MFDLYFVLGTDFVCHNQLNPVGQCLVDKLPVLDEAVLEEFVEFLKLVTILDLPVSACKAVAAGDFELASLQNLVVALLTLDVGMADYSREHQLKAKAGMLEGTTGKREKCSDEMENFQYAADQDVEMENLL